MCSVHQKNNVEESICSVYQKNNVQGSISFQNINMNSVHTRCLNFLHKIWNQWATEKFTVKTNKHKSKN